MKYVLNGELKGAMRVFEAGQMVLPFEFQVPRGLPTTHPSDGIGHISYRIQARGHMGTFSRDARYTVAIGVWGDYDSTKMQLYSQPKQIMNEKTFLFSGNGKAKCTVAFPQGAIVYPGSQLPFMIEVDNQSKKAIQNVAVNMVKFTRWTAGLYSLIIIV